MSIRQGTTSTHRPAQPRPAQPHPHKQARRTAAGLLLVLAALPLAACGPTAEQAGARASASAAAPSPAASSPAAMPRTPQPSPAPTRVTPAEPSPSPTRVGVSGSQAGMPLPVQDACQVLLRRDGSALPPAEAGDCIRAAMTAGGGGTQILETASSWLPQGRHTVEFTTAPEFSLVLVNPELKLRITAGAGGSSLDTGGGRIPADPSGTPEQAYASVLARAAELTVNPDRVAELLAGMTSLEVDYGAVLGGAARTRITGTKSEATAGATTGEATAAPEADATGAMTPTGVTVWLDDYYRPIRLETTGRARGIASSITAVTTGWDAPL